MNREYHKWFSSSLQRDMELLVFGHTGRAVLFFPTRMARFYDYENWGIVEALNDKISNGEIQLFCVDSIDSESFYNGYVHPSVRIKRHLQYEQYILNEVLPLIYSLNGRNYIEAAGCSMGAYHAVNLVMKYPFYFKKVVGMSGRYDLTVKFQHFNDLLDGFRDDDVYFNMPRHFLPNLNDERILNSLRNLEIILAVGQTDPFMDDNLKLSDLLNSKGIRNSLYVWNDYAHRAKDWRKMVQIYL